MGTAHHRKGTLPSAIRITQRPVRPESKLLPVQTSDETATAARLFVLVIGAALVVGGIAGFAYEASFGTGDSYVSDNILGVFPTNGWDNVLHLAAGLACLAAASRAPRAMSMALGAGFTALAIWGFIVTDHGSGNLLEAIPVGPEDNILHLAVGLSGIAAALVSRRPPAAVA